MVFLGACGGGDDDVVENVGDVAGSSGGSSSISISISSSAVCHMMKNLFN